MTVANLEATAKRPQDFQSWKQFKLMLRWAKRAVITLAVVMIAMLALEVARAYQTLSGINPWLGIGMLIGVGLAAGLVIAPAWRYFKMPNVIQPPPIPEGKFTSADQLLAEVRYLDRYLNNCSRNPSFTAKVPAIAQARLELEQLTQLMRNASAESMEAGRCKLATWSTQSMAPILKEVDDRVDRLIYQEALAVGLATATSPNGVLDAFVMLWRSVRLVSEISVYYYGRPGIRGTLAICRDVSLAVALAGTMQRFTDSLGSILATTLGKVGGLVAGPAVDGVINALVLVRIGYLAKQRCRSYRRWDASMQRGAILSALTATQAVSVGLSKEILRQVGGGVIAVAGHVVSKVGEMGSAAYDVAGKAASAAGKAAHDAATTATWIAEQSAARARALGEAFGTFFQAEPPKTEDG